jgi:hypothetical protein
VFCCAFIFGGVQGLNTKDIHNIPGYGGMCLSREAVQNWVTDVSLITKRLKRRCGSGAESKDLYAAGFDALVKRRDKCISVDGGYVEK